MAVRDQRARVLYRLPEQRRFGAGGMPTLLTMVLGAIVLFLGGLVVGRATMTRDAPTGAATADKMTKGIFTKLDTVLSFTLEATCGGTLLHMKHAGYKGLKLVLISFIMQMGWKKQLKKKLPKVLERMTGD